MVSSPADTRYAISSNSHGHLQVPPVPMFRAPETPNTDRSCGRQVLSVITTLFHSDEPQRPIPIVPLHEISPLFAPRTDQQAEHISQRPQTIPVVSIYDISPLFVRPRDREAGPPLRRSQRGFPFPDAANVSLPQRPQTARLKQSRLPILYCKDSFRERARGAKLEPVSGGLADEYYRQDTEFPFSNMSGQTAVTGIFKSLPPLLDDDDNEWGSIPIVWRDTQRRALSDCSSVSQVDHQNTDTIAMAQPIARRMTIYDCSSVCSSASSEALESDWDDEEVDLIAAKNKCRTRHLVVAGRDSARDIDPGLRNVPVLVEANTRASMAAELCCASDSDDEDGDEFVQSPRRDSFSVEDASQDARNTRVNDQNVPDFVDLDDLPCVEEDLDMLEAFQDWCALLHIK
jgi:hypothetical protein